MLTTRPLSRPNDMMWPSLSIAQVVPARAGGLKHPQWSRDHRLQNLKPSLARTSRPVVRSGTGVALTCGRDTLWGDRSVLAGPQSCEWRAAFGTGEGEAADGKAGVRCRSFARPFPVLPLQLAQEMPIGFFRSVAPAAICRLVAPYRLLALAQSRHTAVTTRLAGVLGCRPWTLLARGHGAVDS